MRLFSEYTKWLIRNPNSIRKDFFFNIKKLFFGRYSRKYYPKKINKLINEYFENNNLNFNLNTKNIKKKIKYYKDSEDFEKFHRLEGLNNLKNKQQKKNYILNWYKNYLPLINSKQYENRLIWESYTISYRLVNLINFQKKYNITLFNENIKFEVLILLNKIEYFRRGINNHILKNSQAIIFVGLFLGDKNLTNIGINILEDSLKILINKNGLLRESSSSYQYLVCNLLFEISEFIISEKKKVNKKLINYINKMVISCNFFNINHKLVLFGDTTPDKTVDELINNFTNRKKIFPKSSKYIINKNKKNKFFNKKLSEFYKIRKKNILLFFKFHKTGVLEHLNHQHEDNFHFNLYYKNSPILTDLNRLNYITENGTHAKFHNSVTVNNYGSLINNSKKFPSSFLRSNNQIKLINNENVIMQSNCFKFINSDFKWKRSINLDNNQIILNDVLKSKTNSSKKIYLHFHPNLKFVKKFSGKIIFKNNKPNFKIEVILDNNKNMNLNMKNSYFSKSYGNKVRTLSLILENKKTKNFNNNLKIRFTK